MLNTRTGAPVSTVRAAQLYESFGQSKLYSSKILRSPARAYLSLQLNHSTPQNRSALTFLSSVCKPKLGIRVLVKELREIDIDGAPLLFHAASCHRERSCFQTVHDVVTEVLDEGGLMEQVQAVDVLGRNMLMHAARSNHLDTFVQVFDICMKAETLMEPSSPRQQKSEAADAAPFDNAAEAAAAAAVWLKARLRGLNRSDTTGNCERCLQIADEAAQNAIRRKMLDMTDLTGMNCLHHAAELGCKAVLATVIDKIEAVDSTARRIKDYSPSETCKSRCVEAQQLLRDCHLRTGTSFYDKMNTYDTCKSGPRNPIMHVLRNNACGIEGADGENCLREKFNILYANGGVQNQPSVVPHEYEAFWMKKVEVPNLVSAAKLRAATELVHAARGGLEALELTLSTKIKPGADGQAFYEVDLDEVLTVEMENGDGHWQSTEKTKIWGWAALLAAASKLGDVDVLNHVLVAIEVRTAVREKKSLSSTRKRRFEKNVKQSQQGVTESRHVRNIHPR